MGLPKPLGPTAPSLGLSLAPFQGASTAFITGAIFQDMERLLASPGLLALALPSLSMNRARLEASYPRRIPFHLREASLPRPLLAGFMRRGLEIPRNSMQAGPRSGPFWGLLLREG